VAKITDLNYCLVEKAVSLPLVIIEAEHFVPSKGWAEGKLS